MFNLPRKFIIFDLEYTSWLGSMKRHWKGPNEYQEAVQIGAVLVNSKDLSIQGSFKVLIRPTKNPELSDYFVNLTGITQKVVNKKGFDFKTALEMFFKWSKNYKLYSFGTDNIVLYENARLLKLKFPFKKSRFFNIRDLFKKQGVPVEKYTSGTIVKAFGKNPRYKGHDALNDVRTVVQGLREIKKLGMPESFHNVSLSTRS